MPKAPSATNPRRQPSREADPHNTASQLDSETALEGVFNSPPSRPVPRPPSPVQGGRPSPLVPGNAPSAALLAPGADGGRGADAAYSNALRASKAEVLVPEVQFAESGATSLLDASAAEIQQLGGPIAVARNEALMATVPDGTRDNEHALAAWDAEDSDLDAADDSDDDFAVQDALTGEDGSRRDLQQAPVPLPPGIELTAEQTSALEAAVERQRFLNKYLPSEFSSWSEFVAARGAVKRPHKARKALKAVNQCVLDARITPAPRTPVRDGVAPRYLQFGYGDASAEGGSAAAMTSPLLPGAGSLSWGRQLTPPKGETHHSASGGRPMSRRQRRVSQAIHDAVTGLLGDPNLCKGLPGIMGSTGVSLDITQVFVTADLGTAYVYWAVPGQLAEEEAMGTQSASRGPLFDTGGGASLHTSVSSFMARQIASGSPRSKGGAGGGAASHRMARRANREDDLSAYSPAVQTRIAAAARDLQRVAPRLVQRLQVQLGLKRAVALKLFRALPPPQASAGGVGTTESASQGLDGSDLDDSPPDVTAADAAAASDPWGAAGGVGGGSDAGQGAFTGTSRRWANAQSSRAELDAKLQSRVSSQR